MAGVEGSIPEEAPDVAGPTDGSANRRAALLRTGVVVGVLVLVFGLILPRFVDYDDVIAAFRDLTLPQFLLMLAVTVGRVGRQRPAVLRADPRRLAATRDDRLPDPVRHRRQRPVRALEHGRGLGGDPRLGRLDHARDLGRSRCTGSSATLSRLAMPLVAAIVLLVTGTSTAHGARGDPDRADQHHGPHRRDRRDPRGRRLGPRRGMGVANRAADRRLAARTPQAEGRPGRRRRDPSLPRPARRRDPAAWARGGGDRRSSGSSRGRVILIVALRVVGDPART